MTTSLVIHQRAILTTEERAMLAQIDVEQRTFAEVAELTGIPGAIWRHLVRAGVLAGVVGGEHGTCDVDQARQIAGQLDTARATVDGQAISVTDAAAKYGFDRRSIYNWTRDGWVSVLVQEPLVLVNEGDMALARQLADLTGHLAGRAVFPAKPRPGRPKKSR